MSAMTTRGDMHDLLPVALRDTALTISDIEQTEQPDDKWAQELLDTCKAQVTQLKAELQARGMLPDQITDAVYAQCALLDEAVLNKLEGDARITWERKPLQLTELKVNNAGEELVQRMQQRLREARPVRPLFAIFGAVLDLGFKGRFAVEGEEARLRLKHALNDRLGVSRDASALDAGDSNSVIVKAPVTRSWMQRMSPVSGVALAGVAIGLMWLAINGWLDASVRAMR